MLCRAGEIGILEHFLAEDTVRLGHLPADRRRREGEAGAVFLEPAFDGTQVVQRDRNAVGRTRKLVLSRHAILNACCVEESDRALAARPPVEVIILPRWSQCFVEAADGAQAVAAQQHCGRVHQVAEEHRRKEVACPRRPG